MDLGLRGKAAIVTGAGSQIGFGRAIVNTLAREGCDVVACDIDLEGARKTAAQVEAIGQRAIAIRTDITKYQDTLDMVVVDYSHGVAALALCSTINARRQIGPSFRTVGRLRNRGLRRE